MDQVEPERAGNYEELTHGISSTGAKASVLCGVLLRFVRSPDDPSFCVPDIFLHLFLPCGSMYSLCFCGSSKVNIWQVL